jgi:hypothetical protein
MVDWKRSYGHHPKTLPHYARFEGFMMGNIKITVSLSTLKMDTAGSSDTYIWKSKRYLYGLASVRWNHDETWCSNSHKEGFMHWMGFASVVASSWIISFPALWGLGFTLFCTLLQIRILLRQSSSVVFISYYHCWSSGLIADATSQWKLINKGLKAQV